MIDGASTRHEIDEPEIQRQILHHLAASPLAQATWEGILEWWVMERALERETRRVERALAALVESGWLIRRQDPDGRTRYRIVEERRAELSAPGSDVREEPA